MTGNSSGGTINVSYGKSDATVEAKKGDTDGIINENEIPLTMSIAYFLLLFSIFLCPFNTIPKATFNSFSNSGTVIFY